MKKFPGFPEGKVRLTPIPAQFFTELLPQIDDHRELKVLLYVFWRLDRMESPFRYLKHSDFYEDEGFMGGLEPNPKKSEKTLHDALEKCIHRGTLLATCVELDGSPINLYFLNSPKGRAAVEAIERGEWKPSGDIQAPLEFSLEESPIYQLYEENIGPLTPLIAEKLKDAEDTYPQQWITEAFQIAVENNIRRWSYINAILSRWQEEGRDERKDRRDTEKDRRRYVEGEFSDFIEH